jgi:predicted enzyme related to lactoylglutathione lyase
MTVIDRTAEGAFGWYMNFHDPEGNRFACYEIQHGQKGRGDP